MKKTLCLTLKNTDAIGDYIPLDKALEGELYTLDGGYEEIITNYAHLFEMPHFLDLLKGLLAPGGVIDITAPLAGTPCSFDHPYTRSFWTPQTLQYYWIHGPFSEYNLNHFSIDFGVTDPDAQGNQWLRARMTLVGEPTNG